MTSAPSTGPAPDRAEPLDPARLEALRPGLELVALRAIGDLEEARESVQEALARAAVAGARGSTTEPGRLGAFVAGILRHVIADQRRDRARGTTLDSDTIPIAAAGLDPLEQLISDLDRAQVRRAIEAMSEGDREVLRLSFFEGLSPAEIASRSGEPSQRVRKRKSRALDRLRQQWHGGGGHEGDLPPTDDGEEG